MITNKYQAMFCAIVVALGFLSGIVCAEDVPKNAHSKRYGSGWDCDHGYIARNKECLEIVIPQNAYLSDYAYGKGWDCLHGFKEDKNNCNPVLVPENAFLNMSGETWECARGFQQTKDNRCAKVLIPEHGYLSDQSYTTGWSCDRGYRAQGDTCVQIKVPANAFLDDGSYKTGWQCERGFEEVTKHCNKITLPQNARLDYSGNDWECNHPFQRKGSTCVRKKPSTR